MEPKVCPTHSLCQQLPIKVKVPVNLLMVDRAIRQDIYHQSVAPVYEQDVRANKNRLLDLQSRRELTHTARYYYSKKWARKLSQVDHIISSELPYVLDKVKKKIEQEFVKDRAAAHVHYVYRSERWDNEWLSTVGANHDPDEW